MTAPLRFLVGLLGLWCLGRAGVLMWPEGSFLPVAAVRAAPNLVRFTPPAMAGTSKGVVPTTAPAKLLRDLPIRLAMAQQAAWPTLTRAAAHPARSVPEFSSPALRSGALAPVVRSVSEPTARATPQFFIELPRAPLGEQRRSRQLSGLAVSSWALWRPGDGAATAFGAGTFGGSQAGVRATLPILSDQVPRLALSARVSAPLRRRGAEAALGVEWQPSAAVPVRLLAERRQRVTGEGRSAFAMLAHGGVSGRALGHGLTLDAYGAAGVVGARSRDPFVEGATTVTRPLGPVQVGVGAWGGAQPGTARFDVGPTVALPLRFGNAGMRVSLDYRLRVAGDAAPGSGLALTIGTDF